ncbi:hypothetical protein [Natronorubrum sp. FCH18a]|uniref:hypothetical protein n=1 Tax=Natronorubrum sp. FCH18a TaxID=3447018 RepID=UPI003F51744A
MTEESDAERGTEYHLRAALNHLGEAQDGDLRKTNAVALEEVSNTVSSVLREHEQDE